MLGFADLGAFLGYVLTILVTILCIAYGFLNWNNDGEPVSPSESDILWEKEEKEIDETLG